MSTSGVCACVCMCACVKRVGVQKQVVVERRRKTSLLARVRCFNKTRVADQQSDSRSFLQISQIWREQRRLRLILSVNRSGVNQITSSPPPEQLNVARVHISDSNEPTGLEKPRGERESVSSENKVVNKRLWTMIRGTQTHGNLPSQLYRKELPDKLGLLWNEGQGNVSFCSHSTHTSIHMHLPDTTSTQMNKFLLPTLTAELPLGNANSSNIFYQPPAPQLKTFSFPQLLECEGKHFRQSVSVVLTGQ